MTQALIELQHVSKAFPGKQVLDQLDFNVSRGQVIGLLGRNGAGKTTLLECALGLRGVDAGTVRVCGEAPDALSEATRARIGYVPQQTDLFEWLTADQMLGYFKAFYTRWNDAKVAALLERWAVPRDQLIGRMSGGEKQRLAIIRALAHDPDLLILDEPVSSLDPGGRRDFLRELVSRTVEQETTVVLSTHILSDLERVALDVAVMKTGRIVLQQALDELTERMRRIVGPRAILGTMRFEHELARTEPTASSGAEARVIALFGESDDARTAELRRAGLAIEPVSLEDLFLEVA